MLEIKNKKKYEIESVRELFLDKLQRMIKRFKNSSKMNEAISVMAKFAVYLERSKKGRTSPGVHLRTHYGPKNIKNLFWLVPLWFTTHLKSHVEDKCKKYDSCVKSILHITKHSEVRIFTRFLRQYQNEYKYCYTVETFLNEILMCCNYTKRWNCILWHEQPG